MGFRSYVVGIPPGGANTYVLGKDSASDYDVSWHAPGGGGALTTKQSGYGQAADFILASGGSDYLPWTHDNGDAILDLTDPQLPIFTDNGIVFLNWSIGLFGLPDDPVIPMFVDYIFNIYLTAPIDNPSAEGLIYQNVADMQSNSHIANSTVLASRVEAGDSFDCNVLRLADGIATDVHLRFGLTITQIVL